MEAVRQDGGGLRRLWERGALLPDTWKTAEDDDDDEDEKDFRDDDKGVEASTFPFRSQTNRTMDDRPFIELVSRPHAETVPLTTGLAFFRRSAR
jgi:hypothetical protein